MNSLFKASLSAACVAIVAATTTPASAQVPVEIEGPLTAINRNARTLTVMGITVSVPAGTPINSPTADLTFNQINAAPALPERLWNGFLGGTAIVTGETTANGTIIANSVFVEPAENVVVGVLGAGATSISGMPLTLLTDPRIPSTVINAYGFVIDPAAIPAGTTGGAEGYYASSSNTLYAHTVEVDAPIPPKENPGLPQVSVLRISCENDGRLEIRGGAYVPGGSANRAIQVRRPNGTLIGTTNSQVDNPASPAFGLYRFRADIANCPATVTVQMTGATAIRVPTN